MALLEITMKQAPVPHSGIIHQHSHHDYIYCVLKQFETQRILISIHEIVQLLFCSYLKKGILTNS